MCHFKNAVASGFAGATSFLVCRLFRRCARVGGRVCKRHCHTHTVRMTITGGRGWTERGQTATAWRRHSDVCGTAPSPARQRATPSAARTYLLPLTHPPATTILTGLVTPTCTVRYGNFRSGDGRWGNRPASLVDLPPSPYLIALPVSPPSCAGLWRYGLPRATAQLRPFPMNSATPPYRYRRLTRLVSNAELGLVHCARTFFSLWLFSILLPLNLLHRHSAVLVVNAPHQFKRTIHTADFVFYSGAAFHAAPPLHVAFPRIWDSCNLGSWLQGQHLPAFA